jgi:hypothetical protein
MKRLFLICTLLLIATSFTTSQTDVTGRWRT